MTDVDPAFPIAVDELLEHSGWMRALARQLVRDAAAADDVVQEAYLAALRRARAGERARRGWLARVVYNQAALLARSERHRRTREERSARDEALPSSDELASRAELQKRVVEAVLELRDPYRSVLLLRYYEDLSPDEIAKRQGVPSATVRSQITRGVAQVRERLDATHGGDRRAWSLALVPLAAEREALLVGAGISSTLLSSLIAMPLSAKLIVSGLVALVVWLALYFRGPEGARSIDVAAVPVEAMTSPASGPLSSMTSIESSTEIAASRTEARASAMTPSDPTVSDAGLPHVPDLTAREWITFTVENERGDPVAGAEIEITGMRMARDDRAHFGWRRNSLGKTDAAGTLRLAYPVWVDCDNQTSQVSFAVTHPDYITYDDDGHVLQPEIRVVLATGSTLVLSGWIDEPSEVVTEWRARFSSGVDVKPEDWLPHRNGCWSTTRVPPGSHLVLLQHESAERGLLFSAVTEFTLGAGETLPLSLELKAAQRIEGQLDKLVPRPVVDGQVVLLIEMQHSTHAPATLTLGYDATVHADGLFVIEAPPVGTAEIVALCNGWASKPEAMPGSLRPGADQTDVLPVEWTNQTLDLRAGTTKIVVVMEPTATLEVELHAPDGSPLRGARLRASPNFYWRNGSSGMFVREWLAVTDADGVARIENIPAGGHYFSARHADYDLALEPPESPDAARGRWEWFRPGEIVRRTYTLERKRDG